MEVGEIYITIIQYSPFLTVVFYSISEFSIRFVSNLLLISFPLSLKIEIYINGREDKNTDSLVKIIFRKVPYM